MTENIINQLGTLAIGARMRRLTEMFSKDVTRIYKEHGLDFDPKTFCAVLFNCRTRLNWYYGSGR